MKKLTAGIFTALVGLCAANSADAAVASKGWVEQEMKENVTETTFTGTNYLNTATGLKDAATKLDAQVRVNADVIATLDSAGGTGEGGGIAGFIAQVSENATAIETLNADTNNPNSVASKIASALETYTTEKNYLNAQTAADTYATIASLNETNNAVSGLGTSKEDAANKVSVLPEGYQDNTEKFPTLSAAYEITTNYVGEQFQEKLDPLTASVGDMETLDVDLGGEDVTVVNAINAVNSAASDAQNTADQGVADAAAAQATADAAVVRQTSDKNYLVGTDAEGAIKPIIPAECSKPTNYCVLTYGTDAGGNTGYVWEVIERETTTSQG